MINALTQFQHLAEYDLSSLVELGYGGSPIAPELVHRARQALPHVKLVDVSKKPIECFTAEGIVVDEIEHLSDLVARFQPADRPLKRPRRDDAADRRRE